MSAGVEGLDPRVGLCSVCAHRRLVRNRRGSEFHLCGLAEEDDRFPRYPRLPVLECPGFQPRSGPEESGGARDERPEPGDEG